MKAATSSDLARTLRSVGALAIALTTFSSCQLFKPQAPKEPIAKAPVVVAPGDAKATHEFILNGDDDVIGELQVTRTTAEDTLSDIARRFNLGYEEIVRANPGVDPWLPGADREIILPTQFVLPDAPREGLVINLPALRVFYYPKTKEGEPRRVITHPIGIGKVGWSTPEGSTKIVSKRKNPVWTPPASVREEHRKNGDPLPRQVPPGPDNPLGAFAMNLGWATYLVHGTNKPYGVGMRSSHGCIRFYPEDIAALFEQIPVGTPVHVVNQPVVSGWHNGALYVQAMPVMEDDTRPRPNASSSILNTAISDRLWQKSKSHAVAVDLMLVDSLVRDARGIATPVSTRGLTVDQYLAAAQRVHNKLPAGATWDGNQELLISAEEYEAVRDGKPLPVKKPPRPAKAASAPAPKPAVKPAAQAAPASPAVQPVREATTGGSRAGSR